MAQQGHEPEVWLQERFLIFQKFCFPSILNQSNKDFTWLIYVDSETNPGILEALQELVKPYSFILLIQRVFQHFSLKLVLNEDIHKYFGEGFQYLISSRVDTDDMLHKDFIQKVQEMFQRQSYEALNFNKGHIYDISTGVTSAAVHKYNPFISLIEKRTKAGFKTVFHKIHIAYKDDPNLVKVGNYNPMWCMTVHGLNVSTSFYGRVIKFKQPDLKQIFDFDFQKKPTTNAIFQYSLRSYKRKWSKIKVKLNVFTKSSKPNVEHQQSNFLFP
ncbi:glycosyltransferase [Lunatimonas lonarensis]|nr:glycosyltransferase [Lunatimonas lonarensis]